MRESTAQRAAAGKRAHVREVTVAAKESGAVAPPANAFVHPALFYRGLPEFLAGVGEFVRQAQIAGEPVFVAVPGERLEALRDTLGPAASDLACVDMTRLGRNPGRILAALQDFANSHPGRAVRLVGEPIWAGRTAQEIREATRHEALINTAFHGRTATVLCPYDVDRLPVDVVADARRTHPTLVQDGRHTASDGYADPILVCADCDAPLPEPASAETLSFALGELAQVRDFVEVWLRALAVRAATDAEDDERRRQDFVLAVSEATANSIAHGGGTGTLRLWHEGARLVAEIRDRGRLADPLAGRVRPRPDSADGGRGLWIINQLCDLVEIRALPTGTTLRMHMELGSA
jgi:anti-sigma regulatory factor (Ser/Thr protein kinase)